MNIFQMVNAAQRRLETLFPGAFPTAKHNHYQDYGWPTNITFDMLFNMYNRNGLATAAVDKTMLRVWETVPQFIESDKPTESKVENDIAQHFKRIRFWKGIKEADKRAAIGGYAGVIFRFADNATFDQPVGIVPGGLKGLVEVIPAWKGQLTVSEWYTDREDQDNYGNPKMFSFNENAVGSEGGQAKYKAFNVHPDRVLVWSEDGTVYNPSMLEAGYNDLIDIEKIKGAGGEGFWKNAKASQVFEADANTKLTDMASAMGVSVDELHSKMNEQVENYQKGFDSVMLLQGMKANNSTVALSSPEHFFGTCVQVFASSVSMPYRVLIGNQTGERASTEDQREFSKTCMARRNNINEPLLLELAERFVSYGIFKDADWHLDWDSLLNDTPEERLSRAEKMANINKTSSDPLGGGMIIFDPDEIRQEAGYPTFEEAGIDPVVDDGLEEESGEDETPVADPDDTEEEEEDNE